MSDNQNDPGAGAPPAAGAPAPARPQQQPSLFAQPQPAAVSAELLQRYAALELRAKQAEQLEAELKKRDARDAERDDAISRMAEDAKTSKADRERIAAEKRDLQIRSDIRDAARDLGAIDADDVVALTFGQFALDASNRVVTVGDNPQPMRDALKTILDKKPHLLRARTAQGSGASPFPGAAPAAGEAPKFDLSTAEGMTAYARFLTYPPGKAPAAK